MSFFRLPAFISGKVRAESTSDAAGDAGPTISLHVPTFGGVMMQPLLDPADGSTSNPTILAGQVEIHQPGERGLMCSGIRVWLEARWTDVEEEKIKGTTIGYRWTSVGGEKIKGTTVCYEQEAEVECPDGGQIWLPLGRHRFRFSMTLPPTLPRNGYTPIGRLTFWLVGSINGGRDHKQNEKSLTSSHSAIDTAMSDAVGSSSSSRKSTTSILPDYSHRASDSSDIEWLQRSVRSERRVAVSHNPNPEGGVSRLDDDFTHNLPGFGTCRFQVRVNEYCIGCYFPTRFTCLALSPLATLFAIRVKLNEFATITPPSTGRSINRTETFTVIEQGTIPQPMTSHPTTDAPALWRGTEAGGDDREDLSIDLSGRLPICEHSLPTTLPGMHMPKVGVPIRASHKLVYEVYFSVYGQTGSGAEMLKPGPGGLQVMRRNLDTVVPQCVFVSEVLNLPSYSTVFGENIRRTDEYFYHRIEANLPCPNCHKIPLDNLCTTCPGGGTVHVQHSLPLPRSLIGESSGGKSKGAPPTTAFDPAIESCPTCSGQSVLPAEDPNYHLCGCEIEGRAAAYHVVWDETREPIRKAEER